LPQEENEIDISPSHRVTRRAFAPLVAIVAVLAGSIAGPASAASYGVVAWGDNEWGQLGTGTPHPDAHVPVLVSALSEVMAVSAGEEEGMALLSDGTVMDWGANAFGQLGDGTTTGPELCGTRPCSATPVAVSLTGVTAISAGKLHSMALLSDGTVMDWGENKWGQLGNGTTTNSDVPVEVRGLSGVTAISADGHHSLALLGNGKVMAWGLNKAGELGTGTRTGPETCGADPCSTTPVAVSGLSGVTAISAGEQYNLALLSDGTVKSWGYNGSGQLGDGTTGVATSSDLPVAVSTLSGVTAISAGFDAGLALLSNGTVMAWGLNKWGELGNGTSTASDVPVEVSGLSGVTAISAGERKDLALLSNGTVMAWGVNGRGQLGIGIAAIGPETCDLHFPCSRTPMKVVGISGISAITAGGQHSMAYGSFPTVTTVSPKSGSPIGGGTVTLTGSNFGETTAVDFGSVPATSFTVNSETSITVIAPPGTTGTVDVTVNTPASTSLVSSVDRFTFGAPMVSTLSPNRGATGGGAAVTVTGAGFATGATATAFTFGSTGATAVNCTSSTTCIVTTPPHATGTVDLKATVNRTSSAVSRPADLFSYE